MKHLLVLLLATLLAVPQVSLHAADFTPAARKFMDQRCAECHDADVQKGNLRVDQLSVAKPDRDQLNRLVLLFDRVLKEEMPPKKADQPQTAERAAFLDELRTSLMEAESKQPLEAVRRMNRVASVLHQHETKRKSPHHPHDGFNESADIPK